MIGLESLPNNQNGAEREIYDRDSDPDAFSLVYADPQHGADTLRRMNTLRKNRKLCDVVLHAGGQEVFAHRALLAAHSKYLMELFTTQEEEGATQESYRLNVDPDAFAALVDFVYTGSLSAPWSLLKAVYRCAVELKMPRAVEACVRHLIVHLEPHNCLGVRAMAASESLFNSVDDFIAKHMGEVANSVELKGLPRVPIDILNSGSLSNEEVAQLLVDWAHEAGGDQSREASDVSHVLKVNRDRSLRSIDAVDHDREQRRPSRSPPPSLVMENEEFTSSKGNKVVSGAHRETKEFKVVAIYSNSDLAFIVLAVVSDVLTLFTVHRKNEDLVSAVAGEEQTEAPPLSPNAPRLASMSVARCGMGLAAVPDKLIAAGGYDRGECFRSVEEYQLSSNSWRSLPPMAVARGRCGAASYRGILYVCGGCNGHHDLASVESFDGTQWAPIAPMARARSSVAIAAVGDYVYAVGGLHDGQATSYCERLLVTVPQWEPIGSLHVPRAQSALCAFDECLFVFGGCDQWATLSSVEMFNNRTGTWQTIPSMKEARRGAAAVRLDSLIYVFGGSNGSTSLNSVEILDPVTMEWRVGPPLCRPRANPGACVLAGKLLVVGGFDGKKFLRDMETLNGPRDGWLQRVE